jgi:pentose-5-phosphate-3-epimerase
MLKTITYKIESEIYCDCDGHFILTTTINDGKHCLYDIERARDSLADVQAMVESQIKAAEKFLESYVEMRNNNYYKRHKELEYEIEEEKDE